MLTTLRIKNLALVADLTLDLRPGLNIITGETGAGKSILIGSLNLVLGQRADRTLLRAGADSCTVEAVFDIAPLRQQVLPFLDEHGIELDDQQLLLKRSFSESGANRQFINGSPAPLATLAGLGEFLVDIHGPHEHQSLLSPARQLDILDAFGDLGRARSGLADLLRKREALRERKAALVVDEQTYAQQLDLLRHQAGEIEAARLDPEEESQVQAEYLRASNAARLLELGQSALGLLSENDDSLLSQAGALGRVLLDIQRLDPSAEEIVTAHTGAVDALRDLQASISHYAGKIDIDPGRLAELEERMNLIQALKRKYGSTLAAVVAFGQEARRKLKDLESRDVELARINSDLAALERDLERMARQLSDRRKQLIPDLTKAVTKELRDLGFARSHLDVDLSQPSDPQTGKPRVSLSGMDAIEFQFAPNPGEPARPLRAIASSGELARVMLAIKTVLAGVDRIPVLVFDEVDANVGGETAVTVGEKMGRIARQRQVLCITHLPQVAAQASAHFLVSKQVKAGRTTSEIRLLDREERITELARMLGGQTSAARRHAAALLDGTPG